MSWVLQLQIDLRSYHRQSKVKVRAEANKAKGQHSRRLRDLCSIVRFGFCSDTRAGESLESELSLTIFHANKFADNRVCL